MPPLGTIFTRMAGYAAGRAGAAAKAAEIADTLIGYIGSTKLPDVEKSRFLRGLNYAKDEFEKGNILSAYRAVKKVTFHAYAHISSGGKYPEEGLNRLIERDQLHTDMLLAVDLAEFFPVYRKVTRWIAESLSMRPLRWLTKHNLDPIDLGFMLYTAAKSGYLKHYWFDVFSEDKPLTARFKEAFSGTFKLIIHAAVEAALPQQAAPFYFDNVGFAVETYRFEIERARQQRQERAERLLEALYTER